MYSTLVLEREMTCCYLVYQEIILGPMNIQVFEVDLLSSRSDPQFASQQASKDTIELLMDCKRSPHVRVLILFTVMRFKRLRHELAYFVQCKAYVWSCYCGILKNTHNGFVQSSIYKLVRTIFGEFGTSHHREDICLAYCRLNLASKSLMYLP